jgi:hypothetical protein
MIFTSSIIEFLGIKSENKTFVYTIKRTPNINTVKEINFSERINISYSVKNTHHEVVMSKVRYGNKKSLGYFGNMSTFIGNMKMSDEINRFMMTIA